MNIRKAVANVAKADGVKVSVVKAGLDNEIAELQLLNHKLTLLMADNDGRGMATWMVAVANLVGQMHKITHGDGGG